MGWGRGGLLEILREICRRSRRGDGPTSRRHRRDFLCANALVDTAIVWYTPWHTHQPKQ